MLNCNNKQNPSLDRHLYLGERPETYTGAYVESTDKGLASTEEALKFGDELKSFYQKKYTNERIALMEDELPKLPLDSSLNIEGVIKGDGKPLIAFIRDNCPALKTALSTTPELGQIIYGSIMAQTKDSPFDPNVFPPGTPLSMENGVVSVQYKGEAVKFNLFANWLFEAKEEEEEEEENAPQVTPPAPAPVIPAAPSLEETAVEAPVEAEPEPKSAPLEELLEDGQDAVNEASNQSVPVAPEPEPTPEPVEEAPEEAKKPGFFDRFRRKKEVAEPAPEPETVEDVPEPVEAAPEPAPLEELLEDGQDAVNEASNQSVPVAPEPEPTPEPVPEPETVEEEVTTPFITPPIEPEPADLNELLKDGKGARQEAGNQSEPVAPEPAPTLEPAEAEVVEPFIVPIQPEDTPAPEPEPVPLEELLEAGQNAVNEATKQNNTPEVAPVDKPIEEESEIDTDVNKPFNKTANDQETGTAPETI